MCVRVCVHVCVCVCVCLCLRVCVCVCNTANKPTVSVQKWMKDICNRLSAVQTLTAQNFITSPSSLSLSLPFCLSLSLSLCVSLSFSLSLCLSLPLSLNCILKRKFPNLVVATALIGIWREDNFSRFWKCQWGKHRRAAVLSNVSTEAEL